MLENGTLADDIMRFAGEGLEILLGVYLLAVVQVLDVDEADLVNHVLVGELVATVRSNEQICVMILREEVFRKWDREAGLLALPTSCWVVECHIQRRFPYMYEQGLILKAQLTVALRASWRPNNVVLLISQVPLDQVQSRRSALLFLIRVSQCTLLNVKLEAIECIVEAPGVLVGALHWVVTEEVQPEFSARERAPLGVVNRQVNLEVELMKVQGLAKQRKCLTIKDGVSLTFLA